MAPRHSLAKKQLFHFNLPLPPFHSVEFYTDIDSIACVDCCWVAIILCNQLLSINLDLVLSLVHLIRSSVTEWKKRIANFSDIKRNYKKKRFSSSKVNSHRKIYLPRLNKIAFFSNQFRSMFESISERDCLHRHKCGNSGGQHLNRKYYWTIFQHFDWICWTWCSVC